jgi:hypothetical protein
MRVRDVHHSDMTGSKLPLVGNPLPPPSVNRVLARRPRLG